MRDRISGQVPQLPHLPMGHPMGQMCPSRLFGSPQWKWAPAAHSGNLLLSLCSMSFSPFLASLPHSSLGSLATSWTLPKNRVQMLSVPRFPQTYLSLSQHSARDAEGKMQDCHWSRTKQVYTVFSALSLFPSAIEISSFRVRMLCSYYIIMYFSKFISLSYSLMSPIGPNH